MEQVRLSLIFEAERFSGAEITPPSYDAIAQVQEMGANNIGSKLFSGRLLVHTTIKLERQRDSVCVVFSRTSLAQNNFATSARILLVFMLILRRLIHIWGPRHSVVTCVYHSDARVFLGLPGSTWVMANPM